MKGSKLSFRKAFTILVYSIVAYASSGFAVVTNETFHEELLQRDLEAVQEFVNAKRTIPYHEKEQLLKFSGDLKGEWQHRKEKQNGQSLRGSGASSSSGVPTPKDTFDVPVTIRIDYDCGSSWGQAQFSFNNSAGIESLKSTSADPEGCHGSGFCNSLCIKRAYFGYNICKGENSHLDVEVGRRPLYTLFDSRIQFGARFDGIAFKYSRTFEHCVDFYLYGGPFVVDERVNHFAYATEGGILNILDSGIGVKYSYIDWVKHGQNRAHVTRPRGWDFRNSQWTLVYNIEPLRFCKKAKIYSGVLVNHAAKRRPETNNKKKAMGWYVGIVIGEVKKKGDWSFDTNYQYVQAQAVPECDTFGIGRGNVNRESFTANSRGDTNYKGALFEVLYALTDNLMFDVSYIFSRTEDKSIGGNHSYSKLEFDAIYRF